MKKLITLFLIGIMFISCSFEKSYSFMADHIFSSGSR